MSVYKLAATGSGGTENGIAQLDVQFDGIITAIHGTAAHNANADTEVGDLEVSFISVNTIGQNDTRGSLFAMRSRYSLLTAVGTELVQQTAAVGGLAIAVSAGERLWMHYVASATVVINADVYIYVEDGQGVPTAQRRR